MSKKIDGIISDIKEQYLENDNNIPWIIGYSGGKDSTAVLTFVWRALLQIRQEYGQDSLKRPVFVVNNDTLVENPIITDYVAEVKSDKKLKLKSLVSLSNESGIDYKDATVQLISGNVQRTAPQAPRVYMARAVKAMANDAVMMESAASGISQESFADYYLYTLPQKTSLLNKQTKQVSLMDKDNVEYTKEYQLESPLYLSYASRGLNQYERQHPSITYKLENKKELGLGEALPNGTVRFFEEDSKGNMQFIGEAFLPMLPINEKAELKIGTAFDITISGKVTDSKVLSKDKQIIKVTQTFNNAKDEEVEVLYRQNFAGNTGWTISSENIKGKKKNNTTQEWLITIPAQQSMELSYEATLNNLNPQNN